MIPNQATFVNRLQKRWLQGMFALALAWAFFLCLLFWFLEPLNAMNPAPEGHRLHGVFENFAPLLLAAVIAGGLAVLVFRFWPGFLRLPQEMPLARFLVSLIFAVPLSGLALLLALGVVSLVLEPPPWQSDNPQYIPAVFWVPLIGTLVLAPIATIVAAWWWTVRRRQGRNAA